MQAFDVTYYDGRSAAPHPARARREGDRLILAAPAGEPIGAWPLADIRIVADTRDGLPGRIALGINSDARLTFSDPLLAVDLIGADRHIGGDRIGELRRGLRRAALPLAIAAAGIVLLFTVVLPMLAPVIAQRIPPAAEQRLGAATADTVIGIFARDAAGGRRSACAAPQGSAALAALVARLARPEPLPLTPQVRVIDADLVNAFALPGGHVLVFRGLLDLAQSPDELASVLAHEFGHLALRHPLELAIRQTTTAAVMGLIFGDVVGLSLFGSLATQLVNSSYSRAAEAAADEAGLDRLRAAGIDGRAYAAFMGRLAAIEAQGGGSLPAHLSTHPPSAERAAQARASNWPSTPALDDAQWQALQRICAPPARPNTRG